MKSESFEVKSKAKLEEVVWKTVEAVANQLKKSNLRSGRVEFKLFGCDVECIIRNPESSKK